MTNWPWRDAEDDRQCGVPGTPAFAEQQPDGGVLDDDHLMTLLASLSAMPLQLPSKYHSKLRRHPVMKPAMDIELKIRQGQAAEALDDVRTNIAARRCSLRDLRSQGSGQKHGKKVRALADSERLVGTKARDEYRRLRVLMICLGMSDKDETYRALEDADMQHFTVVAEQYALGDAAKQGSWLWRDFSFINKQDDAEVTEYLLRKTWVHWFRTCAHRNRCEEEVHTRHEEMFRMREAFKLEISMWGERAADVEESPGYRKQVHRYETLLGRCEDYPLEDINRSIGIPTRWNTKRRVDDTAGRETVPSEIAP
ncbi:hypothetical protein C8Q73DRAFT_796289 [Cubamyces lactineus]|nr:hypothetical protein C8Q73DRAFT_796289 [Cubamyces lactineus]